MSRKAVSVVDENGVVDNNAVRRSWPFFKRLGWHFKHYWQNWLMILPAMVFVGLFAYVPMYGIQLAFRDFVPSKGLTGVRSSDSNISSNSSPRRCSHRR